MRLAAITHRSVTQFAGRFASRCAIAPLEPIPIVPCTGTDPRCGLTGVSPLWLVRSVSPTLRSAGTPSLAIHPPSCGSRPGGVGGSDEKVRTFARKSPVEPPCQPPLRWSSSELGPVRLGSSPIRLGSSHSPLGRGPRRAPRGAPRGGPRGGPGGPPGGAPGPGPPGAPRGPPGRARPGPPKRAVSGP